MRVFLAELKRRKVVRVAAVYAATGFVVLQAADLLVAGLRLPAWIFTALTVAAVVAFPIVVGVAWVYEATPAGLRRTPPEEPPLTSDHAAGSRLWLSWRWRAAAGLLFGTLVMAAAALAVLRPRAAPAVDPRTVMVAPFRTAGADASLGYLREGMLDLLAVKLNGEGGPRAMDPQAVLSAWRRRAPGPNEDLDAAAAVTLARDLGAGRLLTGSVVGVPARVVITASLVSVPDGKPRTSATVEGPSEHLPELIDRLSVELLAREAGEAPERLGTLASASLPALRAYLEGQAAYRGGRHDQAVTHFRTALTHDPVFALAALGLIDAAWWIGAMEDYHLAVETAWRERARLAERDAAVLAVWRNPEYPAPTTLQEQIATLEQAAVAASDRPLAWYLAGDILFHQGPVIDRTDSWEIARARFERAFELDSSYAVPLYHLAELAAISDDTLTARRFERLHRSLAPGSDYAHLLRWLVAARTGHQAELAEVRPTLATLAKDPLAGIVGHAQGEGMALDDAENAAHLLRQRAATSGDRAYAAYFAHTLHLNRGRPSRAAAELEHVGRCPDCFGLYFRPLDGVPPERQRRWLSILDALFWDGDADTARRAAAELARSVATAGAAADPARALDGCHLQLWRAAQGDLSGAEVAITLLRRIRWSDTSLLSVPGRLCPFLLEAIVAEALHPADVGSALVRLDSAYLQARRYSTYHVNEAVAAEFTVAANLVIVRLYAAQGDLQRARAALRRRPWHYDNGPLYLSTYLREEGRLAAREGDRAAAMRAFRHYLLLRAEPEPAVAGEVAAIRAELAPLEEQRQ